MRAIEEHRSRQTEPQLWVDHPLPDSSDLERDSYDFENQIGSDTITDAESDCAMDWDGWKDSNTYFASSW